MMNPASLPTPRALLTSLFTSLSSTKTTNPTHTASAQNYQQTGNPPYDPPTNPLKSLPPSHRALLTTLHVLLPTGILLQSLDLLDRGLVVRVIEEPHGEKDTAGAAEKVVPPQAHVHLPTSESPAQYGDQDQGQDPSQAHNQALDHDFLGAGNEPMNTTGKGRQIERGKARNHIYLVRSSQAPKSRFKDASGAGGSGNLVYTVRLEAWNCSCAAFAFETFPGSSYWGSQAPWLSLDDSDWDSDERGKEGGNGDGNEADGVDEKGRQWEFGGLSFDGKEGGKVPVCKHLLACLLVERWEDVLGSYVNEKMVGREEMAGVGGEG